MAFILELGEHAVGDADLHLVGEQTVEVSLQVLDAGVEPLERLLGLLVIAVVFGCQRVPHCLVED